MAKKQPKKKATAVSDRIPNSVNLGMRIAECDTIALFYDQTIGIENLDDSEISVSPSIEVTDNGRRVAVVIGFEAYTLPKESNLFAAIRYRVTFDVRGADLLPKNHDDMVLFPHDFLLTIGAIAYSTARGAFANHLAATRFRNIMLPIIDPKQLLPDHTIEGYSIHRSTEVRPE